MYTLNGKSDSELSERVWITNKKMRLRGMEIEQVAMLKVGGDCQYMWQIRSNVRSKISLGYTLFSTMQDRMSA